MVGSEIIEPEKAKFEMAGPEMERREGVHLSCEDNSQRVYEFSFGGLPFRLRSSHDEQTVKELSAFVEGKVQEALRVTKSGSFQNAAILAALNIAEELILLKRQALAELHLIEECALRISREVESSQNHLKNF